MYGYSGIFFNLRKIHFIKYDKETFTGNWVLCCYGE